jgi:hypothetical protein
MVPRGTSGSSGCSFRDARRVPRSIHETLWIVGVDVRDALARQENVRVLPCASATRSPCSSAGGVARAGSTFSPTLLSLQPRQPRPGDLVRRSGLDEREVPARG